MKISNLTILIALCVLVAAGLPAIAAQLHLRPPSATDAQLSAADLPMGGPALVAWKSTDDFSSVVEVLRGASILHRWTFPDLLIKDARWLEPGHRLVLGIVGRESSSHRVYRIDPLGKLALEWTSAFLMPDYEAVTLDRHGSLWLASRFDEKAAHLSLGRVGETEPTWTKTMTAEELGSPTALAAQEFSSAAFVRNPANDIAVLWGGRLWLLDDDGTGLSRLEAPEGCIDVQGVWTTTKGLWFECYHGLEADPGFTWTFHSLPSGRDVVTSRFSSPKFQEDGSVVELHRDGGVEVYDLVDTGGGFEVRHRGRIDLPSNTGVRFAGEQLLLRQGNSEDYRTLSLEAEVEALRPVHEPG